MKRVLFIALLIAWICRVNAQYYEKTLMDSLQSVVNNPRSKDADRIDPLSQLSRLYMTRGDSVCYAIKKTSDTEAQALEFDALKPEMDKESIAKEFSAVEKQKHQIEQQKSILFIISIVVIAAIVLLLLSLGILNRQKKIEKLEKEKLQLLAQQAMEENEILSKKLIVSATELDRKSHLIEKVKDMNPEQLGKAIRFEQKKSKLTSESAKFFDGLNSEFFKRLQAKAAPNILSNNDLKYCAYISLRMGNKDIANVLNVEYSTVISQKYRLKKKLNLSEKDDLDEFIVNLPPPVNIN